MQILYANDGINYRTIKKSPQITSGMETSLYDSYLKYDFVTNSEVYSSIFEEPERITYVTSNLNNQLSGQPMIVSKAGRMTTYSTPSYYYHAYIQEVKEDFFKEQFFEIFNYQFIKDSSWRQYLHQDIDEFAFTKETKEGVYLTDDQLIYILASFFDNENSSKKTKIVVDVRGDSYNRRSREILASIYRFLPYELRKRHGFISYSKDDRDGSARVSFILYNEDETKNMDDSYIRLNNLHLSDLENRINSDYIGYATYLVKELSEERRERHFEKVSKLVYNGRLRINDCVTYYANLKQWSNGTQEKLLPKWIDYIDRASLTKGPLYEMMLEIIREKVDNNYYNDYLFNDVIELYNEDITKLSSFAAKTIRFADCLQTIKIDEHRFTEWYTKRLKRLMSMNKNLGDKQVILQKEIKDLSDVNIMSDELSRLISKVVAELKDYVEDINDNIQEEINREVANLGQQFERYRHADCQQMAMFISQIKRSLRFEESKEILQVNLEEWISDHAPYRSSSISEIETFMSFLQSVKQEIRENVYEYIYNALLMQTKRIESEIKETTIELDSQHVLEAYLSYMQLEKDKKLPGEGEKMTCIVASRIKYTLSAMQLKHLLEFILTPNLETYANITNLSEDHIMKLLELDLFNEMHFEYLMRHVTSLANIRGLIRYYFESRNKLSGRYLYEVISNKDASLCKVLPDYYSSDQNPEIKAFIAMCSTKKKMTVPQETKPDDDFMIVADPNEEKESKQEKKSLFSFRRK